MPRSVLVSLSLICLQKVIHRVRGFWGSLTVLVRSVSEQYFVQIIQRKKNPETWPKDSET